MIDYKISHFDFKPTSTSVSVRVYQGSVTTQDEMRLGVVSSVTRYRRTTLVRSGRITYQGNLANLVEDEIPAIRRYLNGKLAAIASSLGQTVHPDQTEVGSINVVVETENTII